MATKSLPKKLIGIFCLTILLFTVVNKVQSQTTYYVNDGSLTGDIATTAIGDDLNAGTNTAPFATIT